MPLYRKEIDYVSDIQKHIASRHKVKITKKDLLWIIGRILHYAALLLTHGYTFTPSLQATFRMYHTSSDDFKAIEKEARYTGCAAIHGVFFTVVCEKGWMDEYKASFKPSALFRNRMKDILSEPDLTYKLIT